MLTWSGGHCHVLSEQTHTVSTMSQYPDIAGTEGTGAVSHVMLCLLLSQASVFHTPSSVPPTVGVHWAGDCVLWIDTDHHLGLALLKPWCQ